MACNVGTDGPTLEHEHDARAHAHPPARGYVPAYPDGAPCLPAYPVVCAGGGRGAINQSAFM
eukprot:6932699-Prymnesium_polylepis.1